MGQMTNEDTVPVGERLGSQRLYDEYFPPPPDGMMTPVGRAPLFVVPPAESESAKTEADEGPEQPTRPKRVKQPKQPRNHWWHRKRTQPPQVVPKVQPKPKRADITLAQIVSVLLELTGIAAITAGCALIAPFAGFIVGGILLVVLGVAMTWNVT